MESDKNVKAKDMQKMTAEDARILGEFFYILWKWDQQNKAEKIIPEDKQI